ncbi:calcineurin-like phosphoesterase domain-containing protein [Ditylenchus destructor]|nr:calcineurin-like phosphoesterase domain-containing protein [Ditylenchus destructor]
MLASNYLFVFISLVLTHKAFTMKQILQITDFHYDSHYSKEGDPMKVCHTTKSANTKTPLGRYGNFLCDSPLTLVKHALAGAKSIVSTPELILWTGDNVPHIKKYNEDYVIESLTTTTKLFQDTFPGVLVLPVYGNHDYAPAHEFPDSQSSIYSKTYELWKPWIKEEAKATFLKGGYYKHITSDGTIFLMLNTNLYYTSNKFNFSDKDDPAGQFKFMEDTLKEAKGKSVHIIAHIPPGIYAKRKLPSAKEPNPKQDVMWFLPKYNEKFLKIVVDHAQTIKWMLFGHNHYDTFHLVKNNSGNVVQLMLSCPAVTPWNNNGTQDTRNPAFRVFDYDEKTWAYQDIRTYHIDFEKLNGHNATPWSLEYSMKTAYEMAEVSPQGFAKLVENFRNNPNGSHFKDYIKHHNVMRNAKPLTVEQRYV